MADSYSLRVLAEIAQANVGSFSIAPTVLQGTPHYSIQELVLANGDNTITIPTSAAWAIILFAAGSITTKKLKGVGGDTGITVASTMVILPLTAGTFIINSSALDTGFTTRIIFF